MIHQSNPHPTMNLMRSFLRSPNQRRLLQKFHHHHHHHHRCSSPTRAISTVPPPLICRRKQDESQSDHISPRHRPLPAAFAARYRRISMWQRIRANPIEWPVRYATRNLAIHFVPPGKVSIVERFGGYTKALTHGTHLLIPFVDRIVSVLSVEETSVPLFPIEASTWDRKSVSQDSVLQYRVFDPVMAANPDNPLRLLILFAVGKFCSSIRLITLDKVPETLHRINKEILGNPFDSKNQFMQPKECMIKSCKRSL
ncbi:OLC1v1027804C1 [Oldenlandia corymbosa var. corymbosa]|uniref:OLC1v1027804C1 n=1 Tax=Oldenlandia corymbosa var. corymbosa TaxID=529605 RepID=A0AAV1CBF9_OLDCO|nr:OLC1v1027804C1 [Oldenlandia corymbosa var. corymbosa]